MQSYLIQVFQKWMKPILMTPFMIHTSGRKYGISESVSADLIAQNLYSQIDQEGNRQRLMKKGIGISFWKISLTIGEVIALLTKMTPLQ
jgi:hypothetical protein